MDVIDGLETEENNEREAREAFNAFDFLGRGYIISTDIMEALNSLLENKTQEERDDVTRHFKLIPTRKIFYKEFKDMISLTR